MSPSRAQPSRIHRALQIDKVAQHRLMLGCAAVMAVSLLSAYVQLLHGSVARGETLRADQRSAAPDRQAGAWQLAERSTARSGSAAVAK